MDFTVVLAESSAAVSKFICESRHDYWRARVLADRSDVPADLSPEGCQRASDRASPAVAVNGVTRVRLTYVTAIPKLQADLLLASKCA
ncbi:hypothetical protein PUN28_014467 [Cardiocondyla obscurior]|uniref:Uncharacterized protein n=1 Tax=Cardiocondyla obscurior TaxID=286306 RepID=A0AAW2F5C0_9HYME